MKLSIRKSIDQIKTFSRVFVERPRFAMVIAIVLSMAGAMAIFKLPVSQFPRIMEAERSVVDLDPAEYLALSPDDQSIQPGFLEIMAEVPAAVGGRSDSRQG